MDSDRNGVKQMRRTATIKTVYRKNGTIVLTLRGRVIFRARDHYELKAFLEGWNTGEAQ